MRHAIKNCAWLKTRNLTRTMQGLATTVAVLALFVAGSSAAWAVEPGQTAEKVKAGVDRSVLLGGKTYLAGQLTASSEEENVSTKVTWSKASGPGEVEFADANALVTTAKFSELGEYVLKLTAAGQSSTLTVEVIAPPPEKRLQRVENIRYKVNSPLWTKRIKAQIVGWVPHCAAKLNEPELREGGIHCFVAAANKLAGKPAGKHADHVAGDAWTHNIVESICLALMVDPQGDQEIIEAQKGLKATLEDWIPKILAAQEPDGHLQTYFTLKGFKHWEEEHHSDHEGYVAGYFIDAAVAHYLMTDGKDTRLYDGAKKLADCWCNNLGPAPKKSWYNGHQGMEMALVRFGRLVNHEEGDGKGDKYIELAKFLLDCRKGGSKHVQAHVPVIEQYEAAGHAVRATYNYAAMAGVAMETGNVDYKSAVASIWDNLVHRKYYITGGVGSAIGSAEGFGPDYVLPNGAYCEACSSCGEIFFQHQMSMLQQDSKYADLFEETLYNAMLGSVDLKGTGFYYRNQLESPYQRYPWHGCPCCVGNIPRTLLMLPTWMYSTSDDGIYVNLFIGSSMTVEDVAGTDVEVVQATDYPWSGKASITVNPAAEKEFSVRVRIPTRSVSDLYAQTPQADGITSIALNGAKITPPVEKGYAVITRTWKAGDKIELELPLKVHRVKSIDKVEANRGRVALRYGPLVYSVELIDQPMDKVLKPDSALKAEWRDDMLDGVMVIKGTWADGTPLLAVPNYARENRAPHLKKHIVRSMVWMKDE